jgi:hypothetical protein
MDAAAAIDGWIPMQLCACNEVPAVLFLPPSEN